jgi:hypothetical protein
MAKYPQVDQLKKALEKAREVVVVMPAVPQLDQVAAGLALQLVLEKRGKRVDGVAAKPMRVEFSRLVGVDRVKDKVGNKNLVISWPHEGDTIEKISYHVDEEQKKFNIVVEPRAGFPVVDHGRVSFDYSGVRAEMVFLVGAKHPDDLGDLTQELGRLIEGAAQVVRVDTRPHAEDQKAIDVIDQQVSSLSELMFDLLEELEMAMDADVATNLIQGIYQRTNQLVNPQIGAGTFETVAKLMRLGGRRPVPGQQPASQQPAWTGKDEQKQEVPDDQSNQDVGQGQVPEPFAGGAESADKVANASAVVGEDKGNEVPEPWLEQPKVYSGSTNDEQN